MEVRSCEAEMFCCGTSPTEKCIFVSVVKLMFYNRLINRYGRLDAQSLLINPPELLGSSLRSVHYQSERIGGSQLFHCR